jgi:GAF domain-containing protein
VIAIENTRLLNELRQRTDDLTESLEQQTATSEVLRIVSSSSGSLEPVFNAMIENATRLCGAEVGTFALYEGTGFRGVAVYGHSERYAQVVTRTNPLRPGTGLKRLETAGQTVQVVDVAADAAYEDVRRLNPDFGRVRTALYVPIVREGALIGAFMIYRHKVLQFSAKQVELVENFAAQAVIAIENARLLNELRQRTNDLTESLEQQTATSEVLKVISSSHGELEPVFNAMLSNAVRICEAKFGNLFLYEDDSYRAVAIHGPPDYAERWRRTPVILLAEHRGNPLDRLTRIKDVLHVIDIRADPEFAAQYAAHDPRMVNLIDNARAQSMLLVPMLKGTGLTGAIVLYRQEVRAFTNKQIELIKNFAAQAVIAIENARLLNELRQSLEQQTATADVLRVISASPGELKPVFRAMLENAVRICDAKFGVLYRFDGTVFSCAAEVGVPAAYAEFNRERGAFRPQSGGQLERVMLTKTFSHIADDAASPIPGFAAKLAAARTQVIVPMLSEDGLIGAIIIYRQEVRPFSDKQIELLQNFAAQAVIAIENTRLLNELRETLQQQTATAEVLHVISSSLGDLAGC